MMVLPVQSGKGGGQGKKGKGRNKAKGGPGGDVQVNLIIDPGMLQGLHGDRYAEEYEEYDEHLSAPGSYSPYTHLSPVPIRRPRPRRGIFEGLAMEERWRAARSMLKKVLVFDIAAVILWGTEFVLILMGKRCPSGGFEGWSVTCISLLRSICPSD